MYLRMNPLKDFLYFEADGFFSQMFLFTDLIPTFAKKQDVRLFAL